MTANLSDAIAAAKTREQIQKWDSGEARLAAELPIQSVDLSADVRSCLDAFNKWTASKSARRLPAKPVTVACYVLDQAALGVPAQQILAQLDAIERAHDRHSLSNPVRTAVVRAALETIIKVDPPRSWPKEDKVLFAQLDPEIRQVIARRESERDRELRRIQSRAAELRRLPNGAATKTVRIEEKGQTNGHQTQQG